MTTSAPTTTSPVYEDLHLWYRWVPSVVIPARLEASADQGKTWAPFPSAEHASLYPITPRLLRTLADLATAAGMDSEIFG